MLPGYVSGSALRLSVNATRVCATVEGMRRLLIAGCIAGSTVAASADSTDFDPDFYLFFDKCKSTAAYRFQVAKGQEPIKMIDFDGYTTACERTRKRALSCITTFKDDSKPVVYDATIVEDTFVSLTFVTQNHGDFVDLNPENRTVVSVTRIGGENFLGVKVCHGGYLTADEARALREKEKRKPKSARRNGGS
jgi:hypothetical protein